MKKSTFLILFALNYIVGFGQKINATSGFTVSVPSTTITQAGNDYAINATSLTNQTLIDFKTGGLKSYTISVQKVDADWHDNLTLWVKRNGDGNGSGGQTVPMTGGETFMQVTNAPQAFFYDASNSTHNRNNVPVQYEIRGLSVLIPVKTYTTTVVYTISN